MNSDTFSSTVNCEWQFIIFKSLNNINNIYIYLIYSFWKLVDFKNWEIDGLFDGLLLLHFLHKFCNSEGIPSG